MTQKKIDIGVQGNDGTGDSIRTSFQKVNENFTELYAIFGGGGTIRFTNLADAPASYKANQIIMASTTGGGLTARDIRVGNPADNPAGSAFNIDFTTDPTKVVFYPPTSSLITDTNPTLGGDLDGGNTWSVVNLPEPSQTIVLAHNIAHPSSPTTLDSLAINKGYADKHYLQVSDGQILNALEVRDQPLTPDTTNSKYDPTLTSNYLSTEAMQRKDVVYRGGDTMTGALTLSDHPMPLSGEGVVNDPEDLQAATKYYVDNNTYYSGVNLYVTTKGDDLQTHTPAGREGRAWQYAYKTVGAAALQAENLINLSSKEPGPYRQTIYYTIGANQFTSTITNDIPTQPHLLGLQGGSVANQGYLDAASLLEYNRQFIQQEAVAYINKKYVNVPTFEETRWKAIIEELISAVAYDLALDTTYNSTTVASKLFNSYNSDIITNNLSQIQDAVIQTRNKILSYSSDANSNQGTGDYLKNYIGYIIYALCYDFALNSNYQSIQVGLLFPYANNSMTQITADFNATEITSLLDHSIINVLQASGNGSTATLTFAAQTKAPYQIGEQILVTGFNNGVGFNSSASQTGYWTVTECTTTYVNFACLEQTPDTAGVIVRNNLINNMIAEIGNASITESLTNNADIITKIILTGKTPTPSFKSSTASTGKNSARDLLLNNINFIQSEISGFLTSKYSTVGYDKTLSKRDIQAIVWSLVYDFMYDGNSQSTYAANRYWYGGSLHLTGSSQQSACIDAINYIGVLAQNIITNTNPTVAYQQSVFQYTNETYSGGSTVSSSISTNISLITSILSSLNGAGVVAINTSTGLYGTAPTLPSTGVLHDKFVVVTANPTSTGLIPLLKVSSVSYIGSTNGFIDKTLLGTASDAPSVNTISAKFNVILKLLTYGVSNTQHPQSIPVYSAGPNGVNNDVTDAIIANIPFLKANINAYIVAQNPGITFDAVASARDLGSILEAVAYDMSYGGNSATLKAALQYYANNESQLAANHIQVCHDAIIELGTEVVSILKNEPVAVGSGNTETQQIAAGDAGTLYQQVQDLIIKVADIILNYTSFDGTTITTTPVGAGTNTYTLLNPTTTVTNADPILFSAVQPYGAWNIITNASATITSYIYDYLTTTYLGGLSYNEATCYRDVGYIIDAIVIDIMTGTYNVPSNYQAVQAGKSYYKNASALKAITGDQLAPTLDAMYFIQSLAAQVLNQTSQLRYQSLYTQNSYYNANSFAVDSSKNPSANAIGQVNSSFTTIITIVEKGLSAAPEAVVGTGFYQLTFSNGGQSSVDQGNAALSHIIPGKILIGNTSGATAVILSYFPGGSSTSDTLNVDMLTPGFFIHGETLDYAESVEVQQVTIRVESGVYYEDYPIRLAANVTVKGDDFRRTILRPVDRVSKSPWVSLFFYRDGIFDGMQIGPIDYSYDYTTGTSSTVTLSNATGKITAKLGTGQVPASWTGLVLTENNYAITEGTVFNSVGNQYCSLNFTSYNGQLLSSNTAPYSAGDSIIISGMSPTNYNGTFTVAGCSVGATTTTGSITGNVFNQGVGAVIGTFAIGMTLSGSGVTGGTTIIAAGPTANTWRVSVTYGSPVASTTITGAGVGTITFINNQAVGTANGFGQISTGKAVVDSVSGNVMNLTVIYPFSSAATFAAGNWHLYTTSNYGRHYLTNPLDINSTPKNNREIDVFLCNDATRISNVSAQGHGGFMMVLDPEGQIKSKSPYGQESGCFTGSTNKQRFAGGQLIDGMAGRLFGTVVKIDSYSGINNTLITVQGVVNSGIDIRAPQVPCSFYLEGFRYQIDEVYDYNGNVQLKNTDSSNLTVTYSNANADGGVGTFTLTVTDTSKITIGLYISGTGIPTNASPSVFISAINGNVITLSNTNFINGVAWTGLTQQAAGAYNISAPQVRLILDGSQTINGSVGFNAVGSYATLSTSLSAGNYFKHILNAAVYDAMFGTTYQSTRVGLTLIQPENIVNGLTQVLLNQGINYFNTLVNGITGANAISTPTKTAIANNLALIYSIINNGITSLPSSITYPDPLSSASADNKNAAKLLQLNRTFIQQEVIAWLTTVPTFSLQTTTGWNPLQAQLNIGYIIDALTYDVLYGGNSQTNDTSTKLFWYTDGVYYYNILTGNTVTDPTIIKNPILNVYTTTFTYLKSVIQNVLKGTTSGSITVGTYTSPYPSAGNGVSQDTTLTYVGGTGTSGYAPDSLANKDTGSVAAIITLLSSYWTSDNATRNTWTSSNTITLPTISGTTTSYYTDYQYLSSNFTTWINTTIPAYLQNGNVPINIEMGGNKSMLANDFTQVCDLGYGIVATNAGLTEQVSTFTYYNHVGYYSLNGGQIRSVAGSNGYGDYGLRASGADSTELPNAVNLVHDLVQTAKIYKQGQYASTMTPTASVVAQLVYIIGYEYIPYSQCFLDVDHSVEGGTITTYQISGITHTSVTVGQNVLQLTISAATGLAYPLRDGQLVTLRTNTYTEFTNITNVKPVRPSTALQYSANLSSIYRVLTYNLSQATGEPMSTSTNAILQTANGFSYYQFTTDTANVIQADPINYVASATIASATAGSNTITLSNISGTIAVGQVIGGGYNATTGQATGYVSPAGLTVTYVSGTTVILSGAISSTLLDSGGVSATGQVVFSTATQGATAGDSKIAIAILSDTTTIDQINTGIYSLAWNGRTHQILGYTPPLFEAKSTYVSVSSSRLTVNNVNGTILVGQLVTGSGFTGQTVTNIVSSSVPPGGSSLQVVLDLSSAPSTPATGSTIQFGFNIGGYLKLSPTPVYNNSSTGTGVNGLAYVSSQLEAGTTSSEIVTFKVPYSSSGTLPPVDSSLNITGYGATVITSGSSISGSVLTIGTISGSGLEQTVFPGMQVTGGSSLPGTYIVSNASGTGNGSTWNISPSYASPITSQALTLTNYSYDGVHQVTNVVNTTEITTSDVSKLLVGMVVSILQTNGYVVSSTSETITLNIPTNSDGTSQAVLYVGQQITFYSSSSQTFGGLSTVAVTVNGITTYQATYFITYVSGSTIKVSSSVSLTPNITGSGSGGYVSITGSISGNVLTVTGTPSGIVAGMTVYSSTPGFIAGTFILAFGTNGTTGTGGAGTYILSTTQTITAPSGTITLAKFGFTTGGGSVPVGTIVQSVDYNNNKFVVNPACWIPYGATVSCIEYAYVTKVVVKNKGSGYSTAPTLTFTGGGATSQAIASCTIDQNGGINSDVVIVSPGYGYTSIPTITISAIQGSITATTKNTNLVTVNSTAGLVRGASIVFSGTAGGFAGTVYTITFTGSIAVGSGAYSGYGVLTVTGTPTGLLYTGMTIAGGSISASTSISKQVSGSAAVVSPTLSSGGSTGTNTFVVSSATGILAGQLVTGTGIPVGTYVTSTYISGTTITLVDGSGNAQNFTGSNGSGTYNFYTPAGAGTYLVNNSQAVSSLGITGTVGGLSSTQTYTISNVGNNQISLYIYGSTASPVLGTSTNIANNALTFSVPGPAQLEAQISQYANPSVTTTGGSSSIQLSVLYPKAPGVSGTVSSTTTVGNAVTVSSTNGLTVGQQIVFTATGTATAIGTLVNGHTYTIRSIISAGVPGTITISDDGGATAFVPSVTLNSTGSMSFYCPNFIDNPSTTVSSYTSKTQVGSLFNVLVALTGAFGVTTGGYYNVTGNTNNLYNGIWACAGGISPNYIILSYPFDPGVWSTSTTTTITPLSASGTGTAIGISKPFSTSNTTSLYAGYSANTGGQITQRISLTRATGHDFAFIGTGGYNTSNYPNQIYGNPANPADNTRQVVEEGVGRCFYVTTDENGIFRVGKFFTVDQGTGTVSISQNIAFTNVSGLQFQRGVLVTDFSSDTKMTENASDIVPVQSAIRSFIDYRLGIDYGGTPVPNYQLIGPGYMALNGALAMSGQMNLGGNGIINMVMPLQISVNNVTNKGYVDTQDYNQNSIFKLIDTTLPYITSSYTSWVSPSLTLVVQVTSTNPNAIVNGMKIYGGGYNAGSGIYAFDGTQTVQAVVLSTGQGTNPSGVTTTVTAATITMSGVPNFQPSGNIVFTSVSTGSQLIYDAPSSTWKAAALSLPNNTGPLSTTGVSTSNSVATLSFATQTSLPFQVGQTIVVSGVVPVGYNGIYTVTAAGLSSVSYASTTTGAITTQGTIIGNTAGLQYNSASGTITTSVNSGSIVATMVGATADIEQSKLLLNVPGATYTTQVRGANGTVISTISNGTTLASAPTGTRQQIQAANGLSSFNSVVFTQTNGWVDLQTASSTSTGVQLNKITYLPAGTIPYNQTSAAASPTAVTPANIVTDGNAISNSSFTNTVGVMTVTANGDNTSPGGVAKSGGANTYTVVQVSQSNPAYASTGGLNQHAANSFIKSGSDGSVDVGILQVQGKPIITVNNSSNTYQVTFGFPSATTVGTASFTGTISTTGALTTSGTITGIIAVGMSSLISGTTYVITNGGGTSWTVNPSPATTVGPLAMTFNLSPSGTPGFMTVGLTAGNAVQTTFVGQVYAPTLQAATFTGVGGQAISSGYNGLWTISGNTQLTSTSTFSVGSQGGGGAATSLWGTLAVAGNSTFSNNITLNGSTNAATKLFTITNGAATPITTFSVDSSNGALTVGPSATQFTIDNAGNVVVRGNLTVTGTTTTQTNEIVQNNETITNVLTVNSTVESTGTTSGGVIIAGGVGIAKKLYVGGNTSITGSSTFTVGTGATALGGTLGVAGDTSITSSSATAFSVTGTSTFNNTVVITGGSGKIFKITDATPTTQFSVDSTNGNTFINGTTTITSTSTLNVANITANAGSSPYTGTLTGAWTTGASSSLNLATNNSTLYVKTINATNSSTAGAFTGIWTFNNATTVKDTLTLQGSTITGAKMFNINDGGAPAVTRFSVDSANGNVVSSGTGTFTSTVSASQFIGPVKGNVIASDNTTLLDYSSKTFYGTVNVGNATTGVVGPANGGTGQTSLSQAVLSLLNSLSYSGAGSPQVLTTTGAGSYSWVTPTNVTAPSYGTFINSNRVTYIVGTGGITTSTTAFTGAPTYVPTKNQLRIYINGVRQSLSTDYTEAGGDTATTFTLTAALATGDVILAEVDGYINYTVTAQNTIFSAITGISSVNVQDAITTVQNNKMPYSGGSFTGDVTMSSSALYLAAGTTTKPALKFTGGNLLSSLQAGAIEFNGSNLYYTDQSPVRQTIASQSWVNSAISTAAAGTVAYATNAGNATYATTAGTANAVAGANVSGTVANATYATSAGSAGSASTATTASSVAWSGISGKPNLVYNDAGSYGIAITGSAAFAVATFGTNSYSMGSLAVTYGITAGGDITAFSSDRRLKENFRPITNAVEKVVALNGVIYNWNALANELAGYDRNVEVVGLIAQELEVVLPQAVKPAPFDTDADGNSKSGENYKTIQYEKVVPLLVEAIKEQQATIERQQAQIDLLIKRLDGLK